MDTKIVFRAKASSGLVRLSYKSKKEDYVSNKKVDPSNLEKRKSKLLYEDQNQCLETATFFSYDPKTEVFGLGGKITKKAHQVHYADSPTGKETAKHKNLSDKRSYLQKKKTLLAEVDKVLSRDVSVVRALASHQCGRGSIPGPDAISGLSLCWFSSLPRGFFSGFSGFPPSAKTSIQPIPAGCKLCSKVTHGPYSGCQRRHCMLSVRPC